MRERIILERKEIESKVCFRFRLGHLVVWVSYLLVTHTYEGPVLRLPIEHIRLMRGQEDLILVPGDERLFNVFVRCGHHGESKVEILTPAEVFEYEIRDSRNSGISRGALVLTDSRWVRYRWIKTAPGKPPKRGTAIIYHEGSRVEVGGCIDDALTSVSY